MLILLALANAQDLDRPAPELPRTGAVLVAGLDAASLTQIPGIASARALGGGVVLVRPADADPDAFARQLAALPGVEWAEPDLILPAAPMRFPDDPWVADEWHLENTGQGGRTPDVDIDAELAWTFATGAGQLIAILDSGTVVDHPDLEVIPGSDFVEGDDDPSPDAGDTSYGAHGTGAAGIAAARGDNGYGVAGVAWEADVYAIRLIGGDTSVADIYEAFVESVDAGASVLSNSWGYHGCPEVPEVSAFKRMYKYAEEDGRGGRGSAVVFAAGNDNCDIAGDGMLNADTPIVVAALEWSDARASYSNYGETVDIAAPTGLLTADLNGGGYGSYGGDDWFADGFSGTSGATPVVAGVLALMFEANVRLTAAEAREVLCLTAVKVDLDAHSVDENGRNPWYGCGRIDAGAAVAAVANEPPPAPTPVDTASETEGRVRLEWSQDQDPDGDHLTWVVRWWRDDEEAVEVEVDQPFLDIEELAAEEHFAWTVSAVDPWGKGAQSEALGVSVQALPEPEPAGDTEEPEGCATAPGAGALLALSALAALRRGRPPGRPG